MKDNKYLIVAMGVALLIRMVIFFQIFPDIGIISASDQSKYIRLSEYISSNWDFGFGFGSGRLPLYPLFISLCKLVLDNLFWVLIVQNVISLSTVFIGYKLGLLFSRKIAITTAFFTAINLNFAIESNLILTESIFYPVYYLFLYYLVKYSISKNFYDILYSGIVLGICTLIRPVTMYMPLFIAVYLIFQTKVSSTLKMKHTLLFVFMFLIIISPWLYRNHSIYGQAGLTSQGWGHINSYVVPYVMQYEEKIDITAAKSKSRMLWEQKRDLLPENIVESPFSLDHEGKKFGLSYLTNASLPSLLKAWFWGGMKNIFSPVTVELAFILNMDRTLFHESPGNNVPTQLMNFIFKNKNRVYSAMMVLGLLSILVFRSIQSWGAWRMIKLYPASFAVCLITISYFLIISGPVGYAKYHIPIEPILALLTAFCFEKPDYAKITDDVVV